MKKLLFGVCLVCSLAFFCGCSHNAAILTFGKTFRIAGGEYGGLIYVNGISIVDVSRENSELELEIDDEAGISYNEDEKTLTGVKKIKFKVGKQVSGYLVDLAKVDPDAATEYLKDEVAPEVPEQK